MQDIVLPSERTIQDYRSTYNDIRDWLRREKQVMSLKNQKLLGRCSFEVDLLNLKK
jgi:type I restriction enzyme R subunit